MPPRVFKPIHPVFSLKPLNQAKTTQADLKFFDPDSDENFIQIKNQIASDNF